MAANVSQILLATEAELYVQELKPYNIKDLGDAKWHVNHEHIEKLNMQAIMNASMNTDEFVKELLISYEKIPVLIHDVLVSEIWRNKVLPLILDSEFKPGTTLPIYMVLFHEVSLISLLETTMFYKESCEAAGDNIIDLVDFCHRQIACLIAREECDDENKNQEMNSTVKELVDQAEEIRFNVSVKAVSILRYILDHMSSLSLSVMTRILNTHDIPVALVQLIEKPPWVKRDKEGKLLKFIDGKWKRLPDSERLHITKNEGQVWLSLFHLLMDPECRRKYELNTYNKTQILKLRGYLNEILLDQIPNLIDLQRYLEHLAVLELPIAKRDLVLEQVPEIREKLLKENKNTWEKIAKHQINHYFNPSGQQLKNHAEIWAKTYNIESLEGLISDPPKCANCGQSASKRCSRCQNEWYCKRECQVKHWSKHKVSCNLLAEVKSK
ncbi:zinc finger MYND domain-containing protein 10-like [Dendronephthya gigantea]|uniref:zinc finger MYND domain-containing protein 10-like n=1 Tax=Dendronephthya gigantea TaxID=151771 RepID=UPI00106C4ADA|nr:zinc finger MYND domain-containing protein 10-like [Dendronephthya gigantea]XP_028397549.1 zinc finger MYND domain-containing protein 10-like [Dendronephthya gigantea]